MLIIRKRYGGDNSFQNAVGRAMSDFMQNTHATQMRGQGWTPKCDIYETESAIIVLLEIPGVSEDDIQIAFDPESGIMSVIGNRQSIAPEGRRRVLQMELPSGPFEKILRVNVYLHENSISATLDNGILKIVLPKFL